MKTKIKQPLLRWHEVYDDDGNVGYEAASLVYEDDFEYRVRQFLRNNKIEWTLEKSSSELLDDAVRLYRSSTKARAECELLELAHRLGAAADSATCD